MMMASELIARLEKLRKRARRRLVVYGVCAVCAGGLVSFLTIVTLDCLLWLPAPLRLFVASCFLLGFAWAAVHWILRPIRASIGLNVVAARLERKFPHLEDRLSSTVNFLETGGSGSTRLIEQVISNTDKAVRNMDLESVLTLKPVVKCATILTVGMAMVGLLLFTAPNWLQTGLYRYIHPFSELQWPRTVHVVPLTGNEKVALGESITLEMRIDRGLNRSLRGLVHLRDTTGNTVSRTMRREQDGRFSVTIDAVTEDLTYWFEAGDDTTRLHRSVIKVVRRPEVTEAIVSVEPPPYAIYRTQRTHDLADGPVSAPVGGYATITIRTSKPHVPDNGPSSAMLIVEPDSMIPLEMDSSDNSTLTARIMVSTDMYFRISLVDENGFENRDDHRYALLATPDAAPIVTIVEPKSATELTPRGALRLVIRADDDFGIERLQLESRLVSTGDERVVSIDASPQQQGDNHSVETVVEYLWSVEPMALSPGDVLIYQATALDNRAGEDGGQIGRSSPMRIKIISDVELEIRVRDELALLERRLRQAALDQTELLDRTLALQHVDPTTDPVHSVAREKATLIAAQQMKLARKVQELSDRFGDLTDRMERNGAKVGAGPASVSSFTSALTELALGPMASAQGALARAGEQTDHEGLQSAVAQAAHDEQAAVNRLRALIRSMSEWGDFQELVARTRDLLDRQTDIRQDTAGLGRSMLGRSVESLTSGQQTELKRVERRQTQLAGDIEGALARMKRLTQTGDDRDSSSAAAVDAALRAARAGGLTKHARAAASSIRNNRTAAAMIDQRAATNTLKKLLAALQKRLHRELAKLRKRIEDAEQRIGRLVEQQQDLHDATNEAHLLAADESVCQGLAETQRTLRHNTRSVGEELAEVEETALPSRSVRLASRRMEQAEQALKKSDPAHATDGQVEAIELLRRALADLEQLARQAEREALKASLADIREHLEQLAEAQRAINRGIEALHRAMLERRRPSRSEARQAARLTREQTAVRSSLEELAPDLEKVPVYKWSLERVARWMDESRSKLAGRTIDDGLIATTTRILRVLDQLINAIHETENLPIESEFAEAEQGGGQQSASSTKPLPTVAELIVIKTMQRDINERTRSLAETIDPNNAVEEQLRALKVIGEDQQELRRLTSEVIERVGHP